MAPIYQGNGTWGPQSGILGYLNPFSRDASVTENALTVASGGKPQSASSWYNPKAIANANPQPQVYNIGGTQTKINPVNYSQINAQNSPNLTGGTSGATTSLLSASLVDPGVPTGDPGVNYTDLLNQQINSSYNEISSQLDRMAGLLPTQRDQNLARIDSQYNTELGRQEADKALQANKFTGYPNKVAENQKSSMKSLVENLRNSMMAGNIFRRSIYQYQISEKKKFVGEIEVDEKLLWS